jgi:hypothetical protein
MKKAAILIVLYTACVGCSKPSAHAVSPNGKPQPSGDTAAVPGNSTTGDMAPSQPVPPPETSPAAAGDVYPEKNEVLAILYRARELRQKSQFQSALELVSQALAVDPHSPAAQTMEREIADILKRLRTPENRERNGSASRAA